MLHGPNPDMFRTKVHNARWYCDPLPGCDLAPATQDKWPSVTTIKKAWSKPFRKSLLLPVITERLTDIPAELPEQLQAPDAPRWKRQARRHCTACGWDGHEGQMRRKRTLFGDGDYPAGCPNCDAENSPLGRHIIELVDGFTVVEVTA